MINNIQTIPNRINCIDELNLNKIPKLIFQTFKTNNVPCGIYNACKSWWEKNNNYLYRFYDDEMCRSFIRSNFEKDLLKCYDIAPSGAFRADIWRYCILYLHGGVYADVDTVCKIKMDTLINNNDQFIIGHDAIKSKLFNGFICSVKKHPVIENILQEIPKNLHNKKSEDLITDKFIWYDATGPGGIAKSVSSEFGLKENEVFFPGIYKNEKCTIRILRKIHFKPLWTRRIMVGLKTVILCKYSGYFKDLERLGHSHWKKG